MSPLGGSPGGRHGPRPEGGIADKGSAEYWRGIKGGDFVGISDAEAFEAALAASASAGAGSTSSVDYAVGEVRRFALRGKAKGGRGPGAALGSFSFIELSREGSGPLYLVLVETPENFELRLCFIPEGLEGGTRDDYIDRGDTWLFLPPPDPEDFLSKDLEYAPYPDIPPVDGRKYVFSRVGPGELYAEALDTGAPSILVEYEAAGSAPGSAPGSAGGAEESAPVNSLLLVVEEGWMKPDGTEPEEGGYLTVMLGKRLRPDELEYWPA
jgi:hypothetical protein